MSVKMTRPAVSGSAIRCPALLQILRVAAAQYEGSSVPPTASPMPHSFSRSRLLGDSARECDLDTCIHTAYYTIVFVSESVCVGESVCTGL